MSIHIGSKLTVTFRFLDVLPNGSRTPINLAAVTTLSVRIQRPDRTVLEGATLTVTDVPGGEAEWEGVVDQVGQWRAQGAADGYLSAPVTWTVGRSVPEPAPAPPE
jgi:hypothetical protein